MNPTKALRARLFVYSSSLLLLATTVTGFAGSPAKRVAGSPPSLIGKSSVITAAPPAPVFDRETRHRELAGRRGRVAEAVGPKGILILFSPEPRLYANDVYYHYRQENNLFYLTNLKQKGATLVLTPGSEGLSEILFLPRRNPLRETWTGHMYSAEEASEISGIKETWDASEFESFARAVYGRQPYWPKPENILLSSSTGSTGGDISSSFGKLFAAASIGQGQVYWLWGQQTEQRVPAGAAGRVAPAATPASSPAPPAVTAPGYDIKIAWPIFEDLRLRKSPMEIRLMQHAIDITIEAIERSWVAASKAKWEYEIDAVVLYTFKLPNADHWGYPPIVGCGPNATTLHYETSQGPVRPGDLFLMDVGAEYEHYTADVTRTFPVNGKFTPAQAEIYQIVYDAQEAGARAARPGKFISDVDRAATEVVKNGLLKLGLITDLGQKQYRVWFMHRTSHWLGMNVHDVGSYGAKLEPGMVFTNEPGIYIRPDALDNLPPGWLAEDWEKFKTAVRPAFEKHRNTGVRIEDDLLVTPTGVEWMTKALPRKISDIERFIAQARREAR